MSTIWEAYPWRFGSGFCIMKSFVSEMTAYASVLTITAFTVDRYVAICHPLRSQTISSLARASKIIVLAWALACCCALPYPVYTRMFYELQDPCTGQVRYFLVVAVTVHWNQPTFYCYLLISRQIIYPY